MSHLLDPIDDTSDKSESVDWEKLTDQEKQEFNKQKELEEWNEDYISNLTFTGAQPQKSELQSIRTHYCAILVIDYTPLQDNGQTFNLTRKRSLIILSSSSYGSNERREKRSWKS